MGKAKTSDLAKHKKSNAFFFRSDSIEVVVVPFPEKTQIDD